MRESLYFDDKQYEVKSFEMGGAVIRCRAFEGLDYCRNPVDPIQKMNIFVPEYYYTGEDGAGRAAGWDLHTAPIFMPNTVGGYMPGPAGQPGLDHKGRINSIFRALEHGYVVACAGVRGRTSGRAGREFFEGGVLMEASVDTGRNLGKAPALIVDMKAAIRYLRCNRERIPGNTERIITSGTSAGGALSALTGASGNSTDYDIYLQEIGAADERDDIFAASCYCPIHNLEHADMAYEWQFASCTEYYHTRHLMQGEGIRSSVECGVMRPEQIRMSAELKAMFPSYVNGLKLKDKDGQELTLEEDGSGSFADYVSGCVLKGAQKEEKMPRSAFRLTEMGESECPLEKSPFLHFENGHVAGIDWADYVRTITRMKPAPAFDAPDLSHPENDEFGESHLPVTGVKDPAKGVADARHFTDFSLANSTVHGAMAPQELVRMLNPLSYIGEADTAPHWRIRHGACDRDTSVAIPLILAALLANRGYDVDCEVPWGLPHSGDYDLDELFAWIDELDRRAKK